MKILLSVALVASLALFLVASTGCEPQECKDLKSEICKMCGDDSEACKKVEGRKGDNADECKKALDEFTSDEIKKMLEDDDMKKIACEGIAEEMK